MKRQARNGGRKNRRRPGNLREQVDPLMCQAYTEARMEANGMFPTPRANKVGGYSSQNFSPTLEQAIKMWPTPTAGQCGMTATTSGRPLEKSTHLQTQVFLAEQKRLYPTPTARSFLSPSNTKTRQGSPDLQTVVLFPTPTTGAGMCGGSGNYQQLKALEESGQITPEERQSMAAGNGGQLNPDWVEWLVGLPFGWTDPEKEVDKSTMSKTGHWLPEPDIPRVSVGVKNRVNRLKCLGNIAVPQQFYPVCRAIAEIEKEGSDLKSEPAEGNVNGQRTNSDPAPEAGR